MKRLTIFLFLLIIGKLAFASVDNQLPAEPWRAIVFMEKFNPGIRWEGEVTVKLYGNYTKSDSLLLKNSIDLINGLCEKVKLRFTPYERGMLEIFFIDNNNKSGYQGIIQIPEQDGYSWTYNFNNNNKRLNSLSLNIRNEEIQNERKQNYLTNYLAFALYPKILSIDYLFEKGREIYERPASIHNVRSYIPDYKPDFGAEFSEFDRQLIQTLYADNFEELLPVAIKQFDPVPQWIRENSYYVLIFPLILVLFIITGLMILLYKRKISNIKNKWIGFNIVVLVGLVLLGISGSGYVVLSGMLKDPSFYFSSTIDIIGILVVILALGLPAVNIIWLIEKVINRGTRHKYLRIFLLFLSTSLIPSGTILSIIWFGFKKDIDDEGITAMFIIFLAFVVIGIIRAMVSFFILKEKEIKVETELKLANLRELKTKAELNALHSKINPHFLYNSLNSIAGLAKYNPDKTEQMALSLSKLFRYSINKEQSDWSTLGEEIEMVEIYLDIEKVRFDDRLNFTIELPEELKKERVPRFIIQPLVENAIKHGIAQKVTKGEVTVSIQKKEEHLEIAVKDNGNDFPDDLNPGFGLQSIYDKLEILYTNRFELHFLNAPSKQILIKLS